jgi:hypothetical protein
MTSTELGSNKRLASWYYKPWRWLLTAFALLGQLFLVVWASLALFYSNLPWGWLRLLLALAFLSFGIWVFSRPRTPGMYRAFAGLFIFVLVWYAARRPSHDRPWQPDVAVMPRAFIDGDRVRITGVRNFEYRSLTDFTPRWEEREMQVSHLTSIDFYVSFWMRGPVGHTFLTFNFDNAPPLCVSIETRPEMGESFSPIGSMFKKFELIYVVGDERDLVRVRTNYRHEDVYLYHLYISQASARGLFLIYLDRINELADRAEWYHLLNSSCTVNIVRYARAVAGTSGFNIRYFLNGFMASYLYTRGFLNTTIPFKELRQRSWINDAAQAADDNPNFSELIRADLPQKQP